MRKRLVVLCALIAILALVAGEALAVPMQRTVTVVDEKKNIVYQENILYNNTYKQPEVKITDNIVTATSNNNPERRTATAPSRAGSTDVRMVLKTAADLLGRPYVYGAGGPNSFDCSGFTMYVYRTVGINLPHNAAQQYGAGVKISRSELSSGDLVFFGFYGSADIRHVGIYTGDGMFIHSSTKHGVIRTPMDSPYYASNYKGAVRVLR